MLSEAVVLAHRPPISIPRTTVAPGLLEELLGEIGTLASVYHKPAETFIGKGRIGADAVRTGVECVNQVFLFFQLLLLTVNSLGDNQLSTQKALQTVAAGQQAENLLYVVCCHSSRNDVMNDIIYSDFDDSTNVEGQPSGLAATQVLVQTPAAANLLAGTSANPLDDLVSIFGGGSGGTTAVGMGFSFGAGVPMSPMPPTPATAKPNTHPQQQEDLLGLF